MGPSEGMSDPEEPDPPEVEEAYYRWACEQLGGYLAGEEKRHQWLESKALVWNTVITGILLAVTKYSGAPSEGVWSLIYKLLLIAAFVLTGLSFYFMLRTVRVRDWDSVNPAAYAGKPILELDVLSRYASILEHEREVADETREGLNRVGSDVSRVQVLVVAAMFVLLAALGIANL